MKISEILDIKPGMTAIIGGGGKTTLMYKLADELSKFGKVIVCTSTRIYGPKDIAALTGAEKKDIIEAFKSRRVICVGEKADGGKLSAPSIGFKELEKLADYVIVEADGAHRLPIKAHSDYEPVIPDGTDKVILVIGADAFGEAISEICHRPELFADIAAVDICSAVTPEAVGRVIMSEGLGDILYINKVEDEKTMGYARELAALADIPVTAGSLKKEDYLCLR